MATPRFRTIDSNGFEDQNVPRWDSEEETFKPGTASRATVEISGEETVLGVGAGTEVTVDHSEDAVFKDVQEPIITTPAGTRVICLRVGINGDSTDGSQFVLLLERAGYGTADVTFQWTRRGVVA